MQLYKLEALVRPHKAGEIIGAITEAFLPEITNTEITDATEVAPAKIALITTTEVRLFGHEGHLQIYHKETIREDSLPRVMISILVADGSIVAELAKLIKQTCANSTPSDCRIFLTPEVTEL